MATKFIGNIWAMLKQLAENDVWQVADSGAPPVGYGAGFLGKGSTYVDTATGNVYVNTNTKDNPTFEQTAVGDINGGSIEPSVSAGDGDVLLLFKASLLAGPNADTDIIVTNKIRVIDCWVILQSAGVASEVIRVKNGADQISSDMAVNGGDRNVIRTALLDDAFWTINAGGTLRITSAVGASQPACTVYVSAIRVP